MLSDAATSAKPTKYTQNIRHDIYDGTTASRDCWLERCSAPKTANGMAKHKGARATILSMPRAWAILFFAANSPIASSERPAADIDKAVPENARNTARIVGCIDLPNRCKLLRFYDKVRFKTAVAGVLVQPAGPRPAAGREPVELSARPSTYSGKGVLSAICDAPTSGRFLTQILR